MANLTYKKIFTKETEAELWEMSREEACARLNDRQRAWCEAYVNNFNAKQAAMKAGYKKEQASTMGWKLRQKPEIQLYLAWLKLRVSYKAWVRPEDILDEYVRLSFADITDFVQVKNGKMHIVDSDKIDGQLVKSIKQGKDGVTVELYDKMQALSKLERFFEEMPKDWKQVLEEKKVAIMEAKLEMERQKSGIGVDDDEDDGFLEALKSEAETSWNEYDDDED